MVPWWHLWTSLSFLKALTQAHLLPSAPDVPLCSPHLLSHPYLVIDLTTLLPLGFCTHHLLPGGRQQRLGLLSSKSLECFTSSYAGSQGPWSPSLDLLVLPWRSSPFEASFPQMALVDVGWSPRCAHRWRISRLPSMGFDSMPYSLLDVGCRIPFNIPYSCMWFRVLRNLSLMVAHVRK